MPPKPFALPCECAGGTLQKMYRTVTNVERYQIRELQLEEAVEPCRAHGFFRSDAPS